MYGPEQPSDVRCYHGWSCELDSEHHFYYFNAEDVILRPTEQGCLVVDWGEIKESGN